jgi:hypothetical protein
MQEKVDDRLCQNAAILRKYLHNECEFLRWYIMLLDKSTIYARFIRRIGEMDKILQKVK